MHVDKRPAAPVIFACLQERQRLETILNLCAEYSKGDPGVAEAGKAGFPFVGLGGAYGRGPCVDAGASVEQTQPESDEENLREESSSTESTHQEVRPPRKDAVQLGVMCITEMDECFHLTLLQCEDPLESGSPQLGDQEEEQLRVPAQVDKLKIRLAELEKQLQESQEEVRSQDLPSMPFGGGDGGRQALGSLYTIILCWNEQEVAEEGRETLPYHFPS